ncbi:MAG: class I SAM-dependent methyltransferase [Rhodoferax sp.]
MLSHLRAMVCQVGGWLPFDAFMEAALYTPGLGYYTNGLRKFGWGTPASGQGPAAPSDFVTAPELSPLFGRALARQVAQALEHTGVQEVWEFGAGTGALAEQVLHALRAAGVALRRYVIVDVSGELRARQAQRLAPFGERVQWAQTLPEVLQAVVLGNEVLDAMPVKLLQRRQGVWHERGVVLQGDAFAWDDRPTGLRAPVEVEGGHDYLTEIHPQTLGFVRDLSARLRQGVAFFLDYGFPEHEYYHPQRDMGTLMCHRAHRADPDPLSDVGLKDITTHVDFTGIALAAQDAGQQVLGYTSQARFLMNCGILDDMQDAPLALRANAQKLLTEHEMGELFKVLAFGPGPEWAPLGFAQGDRSHRL